MDYDERYVWDLGNKMLRPHCALSGLKKTRILFNPGLRPGLREYAPSGFSDIRHSQLNLMTFARQADFIEKSTQTEGQLVS